MAEAVTAPEDAVCRNRIYRLYRALDEGRIDDMAAAFADNGVWFRQGNKLLGPDGVRAAFSNRSPTLRVVHLITNLSCKPLGQNTTECRYYMTAYRADLDGGSQTAPMQQPMQIASVTARLIEVEGLAKIVDLRMAEPSFKS